MNRLIGFFESSHKRFQRHISARWHFRCCSQHHLELRRLNEVIFFRSVRWKQRRFRWYLRSNDPPTFLGVEPASVSCWLILSTFRCIRVSSHDIITAGVTQIGTSGTPFVPACYVISNCYRHTKICCWGHRTSPATTVGVGKRLHGTDWFQWWHSPLVPRWCAICYHWASATDQRHIRKVVKSREKTGVAACVANARSSISVTAQIKWFSRKHPSLSRTVDDIWLWSAETIHENRTDLSSVTARKLDYYCTWRYCTHFLPGNLAICNSSQVVAGQRHESLEDFSLVDNYTLLT